MQDYSQTPAAFDVQKVLKQLTEIVGKTHVLTEDADTRLYRQGRRFGEGKVLAVVGG